MEQDFDRLEPVRKRMAVTVDDDDFRLSLGTARG
jgi:hypothetical protein